MISIAAFYRDVGETAEAVDRYTTAAQTACKLDYYLGGGTSLRALSTIFDRLKDSEEAARLSHLANNFKGVKDCDFKVKKVKRNLR